MSDINMFRNTKNPKIKLFPFKHVNAITDLEENVVYISTSVDPSEITNIMMDEYAHIYSPEPGHGKAWKDTCKKLYGKIPNVNPKTDELCAKMLDKCYGTHIKERDICKKMKQCNIGNVTGIQNLLTDYHLLQSYRKFSQKVLGTDGSWEVTGDNKIRLKPTPKGSFPVVVRYLPSVDDFQIPSHKEVCTRALIAEAKIMIGHTRRKMLVPSPDGGTMNLDGDALVTEGREEKKEIIDLAISLGEPMGFMIK